VAGLTQRQWNWLQGQLQVEYEAAPFEPVACVEFERADQTEVRHVEMPLPAFVGLAVVLQSLETPASVKRRPILPTPDMVRDLSAKDAAQLAAEMNRDRASDGSIGEVRVQVPAEGYRCQHHVPPHFYDCRPSR
jgi:hypothetical protein